MITEANGKKQDEVISFLKSLPDDKSRQDFLYGLNVCFYCGSLDLPCYCMMDD